MDNQRLQWEQMHKMKWKYLWRIQLGLHMNSEVTIVIQFDINLSSGMEFCKQFQLAYWSFGICYPIIFLSNSESFCTQTHSCPNQILTNPFRPMKASSYKTHPTQHKIPTLHWITNANQLTVLLHKKWKQTLNNQANYIHEYTIIS